MKIKIGEGVLISDVANITYLTGFSGFSAEEREAYLILTQNKKFIVTDPRYFEAVLKVVKDFQLLEISQTESIEKVLREFVNNNNIKVLYIEEQDLRVSEYRLFKKIFPLLKPFESADLRTVKKALEIEKIRKACEIGDSAFEFILRKLKTGVLEKEIVNELESFFKGNGGENSF